jgi:hypothetical protein
MSKRPFDAEEEHVRRVRARVDLEEEIADLPLEMQQLILEEGSLRPVMRFARASKQSEEVAAKVFVAIFKRDILSVADIVPKFAPQPRWQHDHSHWYHLKEDGMPKKNGMSWGEYMRTLARIYDDIVSHIADEMQRSIDPPSPSYATDPSSGGYNPRRANEEFEFQLFLENRPIMSIFMRHGGRMHEFVFRLVPHVLDEAIDSALDRFDAAVSSFSTNASPRQFTTMIYWHDLTTAFSALFVNLLLGFSPQLEFRVPPIDRRLPYVVSLATHGAHHYEN